MLAGSVLMAASSKHEQSIIGAGSKTNDEDDQESRMPTFDEMFHTDDKFTIYEILKTVFNTLFLLPLRLVLISGCLMAGWLISRLAIVGHKFAWTDAERKANPNGLPARRPLARWRVRVFAPIVSLLARVVTLAAGFWVRRAGVIPSQDTVAPVVVCNHVSLLDALFFLPFFICSPVSKSNIAEVPLLRSILLAMQTVLVDRANEDSRKAARDEIVKRALLHLDSQSLPSFPPTLIFPEGTTSTGVGLLEFKTGAFSPGLPVQPVVLRYRFDQCNPAFVGSALYAIFRTLTQFVNFVDVEFLPAYAASQEEIDDPDLFAENVRSKMAETLKRPKVPFYFDNTSLVCRDTRIFQRTPSRLAE